MVTLPDIGCAEECFILIDGAKIEDLGACIYQAEKAPQCDALYRGTELDSLQEVSPWLVRVGMDSPLLPLCFDEQQSEGVAILLVSDASLEQVADHFRGLLIAENTVGDDVLFRFHDPEVMRYLLEDDNTGEDRRRLMGPCKLVVIQDRRTAEWAYFQNDRPAVGCGTKEFRIRESHLVSMEKAAERITLRKLERHTHTFFPHLLAQPGVETPNWPKVQKLIRAANDRGLYSGKDIALFLNTIGWLGMDAFEDPEVKALWEEGQHRPDKTIAKISEFAGKKSTEGLVHG